MRRKNNITFCCFSVFFIIISVNIQPINPFQASIHFLYPGKIRRKPVYKYPLKTSENHWFSDVFRVCRKTGFLMLPGAIEREQRPEMI